MLSIPLTDAQYTSLATRLRTNGIDMTGDSGTLTKDGVTAAYTHADGRLTIEITGRPSYYPVALIEARLQSWLDQSLAYDAARSL